MCWRERIRSLNDFRFSIADFRLGEFMSEEQTEISILRLRSENNLKSQIQNRKWAVLLAILLVLTGCVGIAEAQQAKVYRVGVIHHGGPYKAVVDGLRDGLRQLGLGEGKHFLLNNRDSKRDLKAVEEAARDFERERVNLIFAVSTSAVTPVKNVTSDIPIVFSVGSDPVESGLVQSFAKPGGRLTGVQYSTTDLTGPRE